MSLLDPSSIKMGVSAFGLAMIKRLEGCRLSPYLDTVGRLTIGVGHLLTDPFPPGLKWTPEQAIQQLALDTRIATAAINMLVKVPLSQPQFDALVSFVFNVGVEAFQESTMLKLLNGKDYGSAGKEFLRWVKQPELKGRRAVEKGVWDYGTDDSEGLNTLAAFTGV